ncbi:hypothetical protein FCM35_KLT00319 [Carex littledalei]|uniref:Uncharacterized protein n=1 Tax=Carex littledalei TaxID=544730 RepID=A0A833VLB5_9POAL|nr:hypothetical protein FCM35_KLT00319 [Carex littledalei]
MSMTFFFISPFVNSERFVIPNEDSLIAKLQNCKIQEDTAAEEICIEQGNSRAITSGDDSRSIQHTEVINPQDFPQQILDYQRFYHTATPMTPEQLFDDYGEKLKVILSYIQEREMLLQQQESMMQTNAFFANLQLQQPFQHNMQVQQQMQPQAHDSMQFQPQWPTLYQNNNRLLSTEGSLQAPTQTAQVTRQEQERTGEQYFNQMELSTGLIQPQATSSRVILSAPNNSWGSTYNTARPSNYFHQQSFGDGANNGPGLGQYNDKPNFNNWLKQ